MQHHGLVAIALHGAPVYLPARTVLLAPNYAARQRHVALI